MNFPLGIAFTSQKQGSSSATDLQFQHKATILPPHSTQNLLLFNTRGIFVPSSTAIYPILQQPKPDVLFQDSIWYRGINDLQIKDMTGIPESSQV